MPLANSCVLRRHCRRLAFFLPCFACTGPGRCTYTPAPRTRSGPASAGLLRTHLRFWLRRAHRSGASFQGVRIHLQRLQDEAPRLGLAFQPPQPPFCRSPHGDLQAPAPRALTQDGPLDAGEEHPQHLPRAARRLGLTRSSWACRPQARWVRIHSF